MANVTGKYYSDCNEALTSKLGSSLAEASRLWSVSELMVSGDCKVVFDSFGSLSKK
ncbi:short-chain dehydrogenase TIC 32, chloroplastic [Dorcoceras hygrometricum]|uniref:Short-chain dehydrogenase TIC 32, chloroplastic n=1 Tax=Dorcoceras hygrometricum TaxID=472368 RepID=A0A2Z7C1Y7_9LAMI|nr:short-chain dehydrogenase TIC 32, chloroplastic [Dorcoceras hygrometricum]